MATKTQKLVIDLTGRGGLADKYYGDINLFEDIADEFEYPTGQPHLRYISGDNQFVAGVFNPLRKYGYLQPSLNIFDPCTSDVTEEIWSCTEIDLENNEIYMAQEAIPSSVRPDILIGTSLNDTSLNSDHETPVNTTKISDMQVYTLNGTRNLFFAYNDNSKWIIGRKDLSTSTYTDAWWGNSGANPPTGDFTLSNSNTLEMHVSGDGFMYVLNGYRVHRMDGTAIGGTYGTVEQDVLLAPTFFRMEHVTDFRNNLCISVVKGSPGSFALADNKVVSAGVYFWNRQTTLFNTADYIEIPGVQDIKSLHVAPNGRLRCFTIGSNLVTQLREFNGVAFNVIKELSAKAYPKFRDSVTFVNEFTVWQGADANLYYYGKELPNEKEFLFIAARPEDADSYAPNAGAILQARDSESNTGSVFYSSYSVDGGSTYSYVRIAPFAALTFGGETLSCDPGNIYTKVFNLPKLSNIHHVTFFMERVDTSGSTVEATIKYYKNSEQVAFMTKSITRNDLGKGYAVHPINTSYIDSIQIEIEYNTSLTMTNSRFAPKYAVLEYVPTQTFS